MRKLTNRLITSAVVILGVALIVISTIYASSFVAIFGITIIFFAGILFYIKPEKQVPLTLLNAAAVSPIANIETALANANLIGKGKYLPPNFIRDFESSMILVPERNEQLLPTPEEVMSRKPLPPNQDFMLITPPGLALSKLFEKELGVSFTKTNVDFVRQKLPKMLVDNMQLAQTAELQIKNETVTLELTGNLLREICQETRNLPRTHNQVGCLLSSAVACVLAKASGKVVTIQKDELSDNARITRFEFLLEAV